MIAEEDYKEPRCLLCDGDEFYNYDPNAQQGSISIKPIIAKLDKFFDEKDLVGAERLLEYWRNEAIELKDKQGELSIVNEQTGLYRKTMNEEKGIESAFRALELVSELHLEKGISGATIMLNAATNLKSFGRSKESLPIYEKAAAVFEEKLPPYDPLMAGLLNNRALCYVDNGLLNEAERDYKAAIEILKKVGGKDNEIAVSYVNLAHLYYEKDVFDERIYECMESAYEHLNSDKIERNGYHAFVCEKCIPSFEGFGYFEYKERLEERVRKIYERG